MIKYISVMACVLLLPSCYKMPASPPANDPPGFVVSAYDESITDPLFYFKANDSFSYQYSIDFKAISGNPALYPVSCKIHGLPPGTTVSPDSFNFKLNNTINFTLATTNTLIGVYIMYVDVTSAKYGLQSYPVQLQVYPY